jgi:hypothetical protein
MLWLYFYPSQSCMCMTSKYTNHKPCICTNQKYCLWTNCKSCTMGIIGFCRIIEAVLNFLSWVRITSGWTESSRVDQGFSFQEWSLLPRINSSWSGHNPHKVFWRSRNSFSGRHGVSSPWSWSEFSLEWLWSVQNWGVHRLSRKGQIYWQIPAQSNQT